LFSSRAPLLFSGGTAQSYVKFNDKPYRGQLEVFANPRGTLTVVNVVTLEDYVRGVVPNELSPEAFPEIEALKAQAVAARTYAIKHRDQFASQGFDILPTTQSQVYGGLASERQLANRAVDETRGLIATYEGQPIDALYTSTCGGRTEDAANIFGGNEVPYLRGRECAVDGATVFAPFVLKSSRDQAEIRDERNAELPHDLGVLGVNQFELPRRISDAWLLAMPSSSEAQSWLASAARAAHQNGSAPVDDISRLPGFSSALVVAVFGERRGDVLLDNADVDYLLPFRDSAQIPAANRTDVALLAREGAISPYPDASLRPRETLSRARMLHAIARLLERHNLLQLQKGTARPSTGGELIIRSAKNRDLALTLAGDAFLLRALSGAIFQVKSIPVIGGESILFHSTRSGQVDFLEVQPPPNGAAADRFSSFSNWSTSMTLGEIQGRLSGATRGIGNLMDLRVAARGSSRRVTDLELKGSAGTSHLRGGRIRSALGLREQLFVIDRDFNSDGRLVGFTFVGRGYGHGVGLCQVGAYGLAREGYTYDKILKAYYAGIDLKRLY
jgi:stage II sporulation protein D